MQYCPHMTFISGSSPLARGLLELGQGPGELRGIIPARAGFTMTLPSASLMRRDHPRSRGVYGELWWDRSCRLGSSPLARGLRQRLDDAGDEGGIIPARAGFTIRAVVLWAVRRDHPRSRGVYHAPGLPASPLRGSSPLARGLRARADSLRSSPRIIPARAGFTFCVSFEFGVQTDHPRSRGVYPRRPIGRGSALGSSPLARGLPYREIFERGILGIIPARAGFTGRRPALAPLAGDHPRSRGVYLIGFT